MLLKRTRIFTRILVILCLSIGVFVFIFKERINDVYDNTIEPIPFNNIVFEKDTTANSRVHMKNTYTDSFARSPNLNATSFVVSPSTNQWMDKCKKTIQEKYTNLPNTSPPLKGKEIKASDIPLLHSYNSRVRLTLFFKKFNQGDYIIGSEFANLYRRDPSIGKLSKGTICNFIEKNILQLTRSGNSFVIQTRDENGIHTKLKIPFVEDLRINIENGAQVMIGESFTSTAAAFNKSVLLPIQLEEISILHNGEQFPINGYISGDYYFIDYSKTKMAYKLK